MDVEVIHELRASLRRIGSCGLAHDTCRYGSSHDRPFARRCRSARESDWRMRMMSSSNLRTGLHNRGPFRVNARHRWGWSLDVMVAPGIIGWNRFSKPTQKVECHVKPQSHWGESTKVLSILLT